MCVCYKKTTKYRYIVVVYWVSTLLYIWPGKYTNIHWIILSYRRLESEVRLESKKKNQLCGAESWLYNYA